MTVLDERPVFYEDVSKQLEDHYTDHIGDPELGKLAARQILDNWHDPHYRMALIFALDEFITDMIDAHRVEIQAMLDAADRKVKGQVRKAIMKSYLDNRVQEEISKINGMDSWDEDEHPRGEGGRFRDKARRFQGNRGEDVDFGANSTEEVNRYLSAYAQMTGMPAGRRQRAVFTILDADGNLRDSQPTHNMPQMNEGERIVHARPIGYEFPHQIGGNVFNVAQAMGADSYRAGQAGAAAHTFHESVNQTDWGKRLSTATRMLYHATGNGANPTKELAAQVANAVGTHGPEATRVLAPNMRRAAYRYRGLEAGPEQLKEVVEGLPVTTTKPDGTVDVQSIQGVQNQLANNLVGELPEDETVRTLLKAGSMPPSRGYIIDKNGKPVTLATGAMDDHYVPFNLRNLGKLNNGSYVRTRAYGGPTTEDFQVALASGARSFVIVSKQGTYRVNLRRRAGTKNAKVATRLPGKAGELYSHLPGNRFGDANTKLVVKRYGRLLDAIQNGKITATDPQNGEQTTLKLDAQGYQVALDALHQQFPYLIEKPKFMPPSAQGAAAEGHRTGASTTDIGYVRPYYLKPSKAAGTYWDPAIETDPKRQGMSFDQMETYRYGVARRNRKGEEARAAAATAAAARPRDEPVDRRAAWDRQNAPARGVPISAAPEVHAGATPQSMGERIEIRPARVPNELSHDQQDEWENWVFDLAAPRLEDLPEVNDSTDLQQVLKLRNRRNSDNAQYLDWRADYQSSKGNRDQLERLIEGALQLNEPGQRTSGIEPPPVFELSREEDPEPEVTSAGRDLNSEMFAAGVTDFPDVRSFNEHALGKFHRAAREILGYNKIKGQWSRGETPEDDRMRATQQAIINLHERKSQPGDPNYWIYQGDSPQHWWMHQTGAMMPDGTPAQDDEGNDLTPYRFYFKNRPEGLDGKTPYEHFNEILADLGIPDRQRDED